MLSIGHQIGLRFHLLVFRNLQIRYSRYCDQNDQRGPRNHQLTKAGRAYDYQVVGFRGDEKGSSTYTRLAPEQGEPREWHSYKLKQLMCLEGLNSKGVLGYNLEADDDDDDGGGGGDDDTDHQESEII